MKKKLLLAMSISILNIVALAQTGINNEINCTSCSKSITSGENASALGRFTNSTGFASFASGNYSTASGDYSHAFGDSARATNTSAFSAGSYAEANGMYSISLGRHTIANTQSSVAIGKYVMASGATSFAYGMYLNSSASFAFTLGTGYADDKRLENNESRSLMIGFNSELPTFFVGRSAASNRTGRIGIGNMTQPEAKLHILGDDYNESDDASLFIESAGSHYSTIWLGDKDHGIQSKPGSDLTFTTSTGDDFVFDGGDMGIGTTSPTRTLDVDGTLRIRDIARFDGNVGIGTTAPNEKLEVDGNILQTTGHNLATSQIKASDANGLSLTDMNDNGINIIDGGFASIGTLATPNYRLAIGGDMVALGEITSSSLKSHHLEAHDANGLSLTDQGGNGIFVDDGGNVGIGSQNPSTKLYVDGDIKQSIGYSVFTQEIKNPTGGGQLQLFVAGNKGITINPDGNVGIGTTSPTEKLEVEQTVSGKYAMRLFHSNDNGGNGLLIESNGGNNDDVLFKIIADKNESTGSQIDVLYVEGTGKMGIGTTDLQPGYILTVDGKVLAEEVKIQSSDSWYDFVFDEGYDLPSLAGLDDYVKKNKHLPDVPTAKEVAENGYSLGEMNGILLKKVEELTLYVIEQQKEIEKLKEIVVKKPVGSK